MCSAEKEYIYYLSANYVIKNYNIQSKVFLFFKQEEPHSVICYCNSLGYSRISVPYPRIWGRQCTYFNVAAIWKIIWCSKWKTAVVCAMSIYLIYTSYSRECSILPANCCGKLLISSVLFKNSMKYKETQTYLTWNGPFI